MVDNTTRSFPLVRCQVDTPIFSGEVIAVCIPNPISDLIIGNVPGVHQEDPHWKPRKTRLGLNYYSPTCKKKVTTKKKTLERQLKKLQVDCASHEKRACNAERSRDEAITKLDSIRNELVRLKDSTREQKVALKIEFKTLHDCIHHKIQEFELCAEEQIEFLQRIDELKRNDIILKQKRNNSKKFMQHVAVIHTEIMEMYSLLQRMCAKWKEKCQLVIGKTDSQISELRRKLSNQNRRKV